MSAQKARHTSDKSGHGRVVLSKLITKTIIKERTECKKRIIGMGYVSKQVFILLQRNKLLTKLL